MVTQKTNQVGVWVFVCVGFVGIAIAGYLYNRHIDMFRGNPRGKTGRAQAEMRNLATALEAYRIEQNAYPPAVDSNGKIIPLSEDGTRVSSGYVSWQLTSPAAYTGSIPREPFHQHKQKGYTEFHTYRYATDCDSCWVLMSYGPDQDEDVDIAEFPSSKGAGCDPQNFLSHYGKGTAVVYDSTNGVTSSGDIIKTGP